MTRNRMLLAVAVAALGYFIDLYDIVIFGVVRVASLTDLGLAGQDITDWGLLLLNLQMTGMLIGGFAWGFVADRLGRRRALLATITVYSLANIGNAFITSPEQYAMLRVVAGFGLAGELGAGVTLISELLPKNRRGYGTTVISFLGLVGALTASYVGVLFGWRTAYLAGGCAGLLVLGGRLLVLQESAIYAHGHDATRGDLRLLLLRAPALRRFLAVIAVGVPIWYVSALFVNFSPEYGKALGYAEPLRVADVLRWQAVGLALGSAATGLLSEWLRSRRRIVGACVVALIALTAGLMCAGSAAAYIWLMFFIGLAQGYWTAFVTMAAEQFGTNLRGTVATAVPNIVRAMTVPVTLGLKLLWPLIGLVEGTLVIGALVYALALLGLSRLRETWGSDLDYAEK